MAIKANHELLGREWTFNIPLETVLQLKGNELALYATAPKASQRAAMIQSLFDLVAYQHLGFGEVPGLREHVETGVDRSVEYFWGDWWKAEGIARLSPERKQQFRLDDLKKVEDTLRTNTRALDKSDPERELEWYSALLGGLFLGGLANRWTDVSQICSWFDTSIPPEYSAGTIEDQFFQLYVCIACELSPEPVTGVEELLSEVRKCRLKRTRLLCAAWESVLTTDQAAFDKAFTESVKHFVANPSPIRVACEWIAMHQSVIWLIAEQRGLRFPPMSEKCVAAIVTPKSLGFTE